MKKLTIIGILVLISGSIIYLLIMDEISGVAQAIIIGLIIGSVFALSQLKKS